MGAERRHDRIRGRAEIVAPQPAAAGFGPQQQAEYQAQVVRRAVEVMKVDFEPATWTACWQFVVEGRPAAEVAVGLGISENAVYLAKGRILRRLREELAGMMD